MTDLAKIHYEDQHLIVIDKPAGLLSQGEKTGDPNVVDWLRERLGRPYVGLVHRLDRGTSGLMVVAKRTKAAQRLTLSLREGTLVRRYQALLEGKLETAAHLTHETVWEEWKNWIVKDPTTNTVRVVKSKIEGAKEAVLRVRVLQMRTGLTLAEFALETGRSHQIRVQAQAHGCPLLGDHKYSIPLISGSSGRTLSRPALHSSFLSFPHPMTKEVLEFTSALPPDLAKQIEYRGIR